jgi:hypothetical protein
MAGGAGQTPDRLILYIESWRFMARVIIAPADVDIYLELVQAVLEYLLDWAEGQYPDVSAADAVRVVAAMAAALGVWSTQCVCVACSRGQRNAYHYVAHH